MLNNSEFKLLFIGDIVGRAGRWCVKKYLSEIDSKNNYDIVIANVENASHGFGLTKKNHDEIIEFGVDVMTSGNHIWDKKDVLSYIEESNALIRPYNYPKDTPGIGYRIFKNKIVVINLLGKTFMPPIDCPFESIKNLIKSLKEKGEFEDKILFVDFHAEATAEKICFANFSKALGINCVVGTHTHIQTSDEEIIDDSLAYITDAGSCSSTKGVIGMDFASSLKKITSPINERFEVEMAEPYKFNAVEIIFENNIPKSIKRINKTYLKSEVCDCEN